MHPIRNFELLMWLASPAERQQNAESMNYLFHVKTNVSLRVTLRTKRLGCWVFSVGGLAAWH